MRLEYLAAIAIAAFAAGAGAAVHSSLPLEKQSTLSAAQLANQLAEVVDSFLLRKRET